MLDVNGKTILMGGGLLTCGCCTPMLLARLLGWALVLPWRWVSSAGMGRLHASSIDGRARGLYQANKCTCTCQYMRTPYSKFQPLAIGADDRYETKY